MHLPLHCPTSARAPILQANRYLWWQKCCLATAPSPPWPVGLREMGDHSPLRPEPRKSEAGSESQTPSLVCWEVKRNIPRPGGQNLPEAPRSRCRTVLPALRQGPGVPLEHPPLPRLPLLRALQPHQTSSAPSGARFDYLLLAPTCPRAQAPHAATPATHEDAAASASARGRKLRHTSRHPHPPILGGVHYLTSQRKVVSEEG